MKKCPFSIQCRDSNSQPMEHESPPITTGPAGLLPITKIGYIVLILKSAKILRSQRSSILFLLKIFIIRENWRWWRQLQIFFTKIKPEFVSWTLEHRCFTTLTENGTSDPTIFSLHKIFVIS